MDNKVFRFTVFGEPIAKGRPRFSVSGGFARTFTPKKTRIAEDNFRAQAIQYRPPAPIETALSVDIKVYRSIPMSWSIKKRMAAISGELRPISRPDIDNYVKLVLDALNGIFWRDDTQIVQLIAEKYYSPDPQTEIVITDFEED
jgi:Holliday junction resolvase RusA-like endonuclease